MKPYKGEIYNWYRQDSYVPSPVKGQVHLKFVILGNPKGHPDFPNTKNLRTSLVVKYEEVPRASHLPRYIQIETLNSRYLLVGEGKGL